MHVDFLLIGQGICGTFLSRYLQKAGYSVLVIDEQNPAAASRTAAGIINPVTGRRIVKTWLIDEVLPFAQQAYAGLGAELNITAIEQKNIIDFFPTPQMKIAFEKRFSEDSQYLAKPADTGKWHSFFHYDFDYGIIEPVYLVNLQELLPAWRNVLQQHNSLWDEKFDIAQLQVSTGKVQYKDVTASAIIFCDGITSGNNMYFHNLPFAPNKGEMLLVEINDLPTGYIYKRGLNLAPWKENIFWAGSSYEWDFDNDQPTPGFRERTMAALQSWLKLPVTLLEHRASVRPATLERRPFIGFHPLHPSVGIFNGMGTKGCSLAPFFAKQFADHISGKTTLYPEASVQRFKRILSVR